MDPGGEPPSPSVRSRAGRVGVGEPLEVRRELRGGAGSGFAGARAGAPTSSPRSDAAWSGTRRSASVYAARLSGSPPERLEQAGPLGEEVGLEGVGRRRRASSSSSELERQGELGAPVEQRGGPAERRLERAAQLSRAARTRGARRRGS